MCINSNDWESRKEEMNPGAVVTCDCAVDRPPPPKRFRVTTIDVTWLAWSENFLMTIRGKPACGDCGKINE
ncbi:hypothetical protein J6590_047243 [Homalodisca vitripennis]|nr:hypothetical protein J6590_047243 [Homalodisca vitripennis]